MWKWFDPCSIIRAIAEITKTRRNIKLLFLGAKRFESDTTGINVAYATEEAISLSKQLGVYNRTVFFHDTWVPYNERQNYFLEANIGISAHFNTLETRFSFRTRILDYLWAELPVITTTGDYLSDLVEQRQLGIVIPPSHIEQIRKAILRLADDQAFVEQCRANIRRIRTQFVWSQVIKPLEAFCASPCRTSYLSRPAIWHHLLKFYTSTGKNLIKYRGHQKILAKIRAKL